MLPPDNFQEDPAPVVAHRTSPTNIGLYLLSTASAHDFGWLGLADTAERLEATLATMGRLPRFRGHFYNWYDTCDLRPLDPQYVSSVDSGNLAGHLIALANACEEWRGLDAATRLNGIGDALDVMAEEAESLRDRRRTETVTWRQFDDALATLVTDARRPLESPAEIVDQLARLAGSADTLVDVTTAFTLERGDSASSDLLFWAQAVRHAIASHERDLGRTGPAAGDLAARLGRDRPHRPGNGAGDGVSDSCSTRSACCSPSGSWSRRGRPTRVAMICWRRRRGLPVTSASPRAICPPAIGSVWDTTSPRSRTAPL
jgi:cyclic beta-1,2-glucan synthetase